MLEVRTKRHEVRTEALKAFEALQGRQGLTQDEQVEAFKTAATALRAAADLADEGAVLAATRNFEANQAEKAKALAEAEAALVAEAEAFANGEVADEDEV
jgi:hypothetical protein